ncbi:murein L,D-transpeptidase catalytic domain-containing protein [uncultured Pontibacter sp.]|uniref:murein L,D-transpeptidase catalytic domain-containing protein n=1 Tax=uncultured Pontibacter sp. TaxID=453356 RepID=UPI00262865EE|nr:murein L,D-transpeptidase catalytic domain family protein [uncultured Pontibacter sp.]
MKVLKPIFMFFLLLLISCSSPEGDESQAIWETANPGPDMAKLEAKAHEAEEYCRTRNLNTDFFIIIDMSMHSGLKRFFIWDFNQSKITNSFLVSHGACDNPWSSDVSKDQVKFSNIENSHCSSVGKYILGERGPSQWGIRIKYLMHGQEGTNNNATRRDIVFHSWEQVSDEEVYPAGTPEGWGCPAISNSAMRAVDQKLQQAVKRTLMWIVQ